MLTISLKIPLNTFTVGFLSVCFYPGWNCTPRPPVGYQAAGGRQAHPLRAGGAAGLGGGSAGLLPAATCREAAGGGRDRGPGPVAAPPGAHTAPPTPPSGVSATGDRAGLGFLNQTLKHFGRRF